MNSDPLSLLRGQIDDLDDQIISLLARRFALLADVVKVKREFGIPHRVESRVQAVLDRNEARGQASGLPSGYVRHIFEYIIEQSHKYELPQLGH